MTPSPGRQAYVEGFAHDVFISYGHLDNDPGTLWVKKLHHRLQDRLPQILGENVSIWRDEKLEGVDMLWETLRGKVAQSALFLTVLTPRYVKSEACRKEADWFVECIKRSPSPTIEKMARILRVQKTRYKDEEPASLREFETLGFRFYDEDEFTSHFAEYSADKDADPAGFQKFYRKSEDLAQAIAQLLESTRRVFQRSPARNVKTVFVAYATSDLAQQRQTIVNACLGKGYRVVPDETPPSNRSALEGIVNRSLETCHLAIHGMGSLYGLVPEGETEQRSIVRLQYEQVRQKGIRQMVWIPEDLSGVESRQTEFLSSIEITGDARCEFVKKSLWPFIEGALDELAKPEVKPKSDRSKSVFILFEKKDLDKPSWKAIKSYLVDRGYPVFLPAFQGTGGVIRKLEMENIQKTAATLIYYGGATDSWVQLKRGTLLKALAASEAKSKYVRALYLCAPEDDVKRNVYLDPNGQEVPEERGFSPLLVVGQCKEHFHPEELEPILRVLEQNA
jgi:TIR domain